MFFEKLFGYISTRGKWSCPELEYPSEAELEEREKIIDNELRKFGFVVEIHEKKTKHVI